MLPSYLRPTRETVLGVARAAEQLGFDSVWTNSHTVVPASFKPRYPYSEDGVPSWNAGTAWADEARPYLPKGPSGVAVRTLASLAFETFEV